MQPDDVYALIAGASAAFLGLVGIGVAFHRKDRDRFERLAKLIPDVWAAVQQARRRRDGAAKNDPLGAALGKLTSMLGGTLSSSERATAVTKLQAEHEQRGHPAP